MFSGQEIFCARIKEPRIKKLDVVVSNIGITGEGPIKLFGEGFVVKIFRNEFPYNLSGNAFYIKVVAVEFRTNTGGDGGGDDVFLSGRGNVLTEVIDLGVEQADDDAGTVGMQVDVGTFFRV